MSQDDEKHWMDLMKVIHKSVDGGMKYNVGTLLLVLSRPAPAAAATGNSMMSSSSIGKSETSRSVKQSPY